MRPLVAPVALRVLATQLPLPPHLELLLAEPKRSVSACPELVAHQAGDVFALWERWEEVTGERQEPPFWAAVWPGAALMARLLLDEPERVQGRRVIDLGCGSGVVAIAAAYAGAREALANDVDAVAVDAALLNAACNAVTVCPLVQDLTATSELPGSGDLIVVCEMFYEATGASRLLRWLSAARQRGAQILVGDGGRAFVPHQELRLLQERVLPVNAELEGTAERRARVFEWA